MKIEGIATQTSRRFDRFNKLRGGTEKFWDVVVLTAVDETQKKSYEIQLKIKLDKGELPLSPRYIVVSDPPGSKIGNGGSTFVVIEELVNLFGDNAWTKKVIIIHAGGYSQRLPNASILGKAFIGIPIGDPMYQAIELKLATYVDFPSKISGGGIFVCCADSIEVYNDDDVLWTFASEGFTALSHLSTVSIGKTHGVFVLDSPVSNNSIVWTCRKFLHKPTIELMESTENCIVLSDETDKWVMTDSAFFISIKTAKMLLKFYQNRKPLTCEVDAYGDFLQALGNQSTPDYIYNTKNVFTETYSLIETRRHIYDLLQETPLHAVVLSQTPQLRQNTNSPKNEESISSIFYHIGTMPEYQYNLTKDKDFKTILDVGALISCKGMPHSYTVNTIQTDYSGVKVTRQGALSCCINQLQCNTPCIIGSVLQSNVMIGEGSIVEYSFIRESVSIGQNCILSNCSFPKEAVVPPGVFMHTMGIISDGITLYVTVVFDVDVDMKKSVSSKVTHKHLKYFGKSLGECFGSVVDFNCINECSLWNARIFPSSKTMEESCQKACDALNKMKGETRLYSGSENFFSMEDILVLKDVQSHLEFRRHLYKQVLSVSSSSHLNTILYSCTA